MTSPTTRTPSKASASTSRNQPASKGKAAKGGVANRSGGVLTNRAQGHEVTETARELARLVVLQAREPEVAGVLSEDLPAVMQAVIESAKGGGTTAVADRGLLMRLMRHPASSAADRQDADRARPMVLRHGLVGRLTDGPAGAIGHAGVTAPEPAAVKAPF